MLVVLWKQVVTQCPGGHDVEEVEEWRARRPAWNPCQTIYKLPFDSRVLEGLRGHQGLPTSSDHLLETHPPIKALLIFSG